MLSTSSDHHPGACYGYTGEYLTRTWEFYQNYLKRFSNSPARILDMGCGLGLFMECCKQNGIECIGIEYNQAAVDSLAEKGFTVFQHDLAQPLDMFKENSFDAIFSFQVIEHLSSVAQEMSIKEAFRILAPKGQLHIDSPCIFNPEAHVPGHISLLTPKKLKEMASEAGFTNISMAFNYPQKIDDVPQELLSYIWKTYQPDFMAATATIHAIKQG